MLLFFLGVLAASAEMINVDWRMGMDRDEQYIEANPGDSIKFSWQYGHNVYIMNTCNESQFKDFKCPSSSNGSKNLGSSSPVTYKISDDATGYLCFWCQVGQHCIFGQHLTVKLPGKPQDQPVAPSPITIDWKLGMEKEGKYLEVAKPGQKLIFKWSGAHNVFLMDECDGEGDQLWSDFQCPSDESDSKDLGGNSPVTYTVPENAPKYLCFWCSIGYHCEAGQHSTVKVKFAEEAKQLPAMINVDWKMGMDRKDQYIMAKPGDSIKFSWQYAHNVYIMNTCNESQFKDFKCPSSANGSKNLGDRSAVTYKIPADATGYLCFWCQIGQHCMYGQHLTVKLPAKPAMINVDWKMEMDRKDQYIEANPGDILKFSWQYGHNVYIMNTCNESQFKDFQCPTTSNGSKNLGDSSPVTYKIPEDATGYLCFWCQINQHCVLGQHMTVKLPAKEEAKQLPAMINVDWKMGMERKDAYIEANPGDSIKFSWQYGHNVYIMNTCNESQFKDFKCPSSSNGSKNLGDRSPVTYKIPADATGYLCFWCQVGQHCNYGQHLTVKLPAKDEAKLAPVNIEWMIGMGAMGKSITAKPGQELVFKFGRGHNVLLMKSCDGAGKQRWSDFTCPRNENDSINLGESGPVKYTIPTENPPAYLCFWCSVGGHCNWGQHSTVKVEGVGNGDEKEQPKGDEKKDKAGRQNKRARRKADKKADRRRGRRGERGGKRERKGRKERTRRRRRN